MAVAKNMSSYQQAGTCLVDSQGTEKWGFFQPQKCGPSVYVFTLHFGIKKNWHFSPLNLFNRSVQWEEEPSFFHWGLHLKSSIREQPDSCIMVVQFAIFLHLNKYWLEKNDFVLIITDLNINYFALHSGVNFRILHFKPLKPSSVTIFILQIQNEFVSLFLVQQFLLEKGKSTQPKSIVNLPVILAS